MKVLIIKPDHDAELVDVPDADVTLEYLQGAVGGYIEPIWRGDGSWVMYGNEESKVHGQQENVLATMTAEAFGWDGRSWYDYVAGTVIVLGFNPDADEDEGENYYLDVPEAVVEFTSKFNIAVSEDVQS